MLRFNGAVEWDPAIDAWMKEHADGLRAIAHDWFEVMRKCGDEVWELLHDGCMFGRCALRLRQCIRFACKCEALSRRSATGSGSLVARHRQVHAPCGAETASAATMRQSNNTEKHLNSILTTPPSVKHSAMPTSGTANTGKGRQWTKAMLLANDTELHIT